jgi:hypothetical protein
MAFERKFVEDILKKYNLFKEGESNLMSNSAQIHFHTNSQAYINSQAYTNTQVNPNTNIKEFELAEKISHSSKK